MRDGFWAVVIILIGLGLYSYRNDQNTKQELNNLSDELNELDKENESKAKEIEGLRLQMKCKDLEESVKTLQQELNVNKKREADINKIDASNMNTKLINEAQSIKNKIAEIDSKIESKNGEIQKIPCKVPENAE